MTGSDATSTAERLRAQAAAHGAHNYHPLPVVIAEAEGSWVTDVDGRRYVDMMSAYSAVSCGHAHPRIVATLTEQAARLAVTSRAFHNPVLPKLLELLDQRGFQLVTLDQAERDPAYADDPDRAFPSGSTLLDQMSAVKGITAARSADDSLSKLDALCR